MANTNSKVDAYLGKLKKWRQETEALRALIRGFPLVEELKWGQPCYTFEGSNLLILQGFKDYCALMFFKGALLKDAQGLLTAPGENSQSARQLRFTGLDGIAAMDGVLRAYIAEAMAVEQAGLKVALKKVEEFAVPDEFQARLDGMPALKAAFDALTPGRRRVYLMHFASAKQAKTRVARVEKCLPRILNGEGLDEGP